MSVVDKPIVDRKLVLAQVEASSTYFDLLGLPPPCTPLVSPALRWPVHALLSQVKTRWEGPRGVAAQTTCTKLSGKLRLRQPHAEQPPTAAKQLLPGRARSSATQTKRRTRRFVLLLIASAHQHCGAPNMQKLASFRHIYCPPPRCRCWASSR